LTLSQVPAEALATLTSGVATLKGRETISALEPFSILKT
jgi:hypothetical protein